MSFIAYRIRLSETRALLFPQRRPHDNSGVMGKNKDRDAHQQPLSWNVTHAHYYLPRAAHAMSRYSIIAETFDFKQRSILNGTREIRNGLTPGSARIEKCVYRYVRSTRETRSRSVHRPTLFSRPTLRPGFNAGSSLFAERRERERERERMRGVAAHGVFRPLDPCAWCNTDHTSIHCKWTSILVINTSRLSLGPSLRRPRHCLPRPSPSPPSSLLLPLLFLLVLRLLYFTPTVCTIIETRGILARDLHVSDTRVGGSDWRLSRHIVSGRVCNSAAGYKRTQRGECRTHSTVEIWRSKIRLPARSLWSARNANARARSGFITLREKKREESEAERGRTRDPRDPIRERLFRAVILSMCRDPHPSAPKEIRANR